MKKRKIVGMLCFVTGLSLVLFNGCDKHIRMNTDKCAEVALEYLESKYQTEFEVLNSSEPMRIGGSAGYAEVTVSRKSEDNENRYMVIVYPDGSSDADKDGYYDSYKVISDDYMCYLLQDYAKNEVDNLLMEAGLTRFISSIGIGEMGTPDDGFSGFWGFAADFPIQSEDSFSLNDLLDNRRISMHCGIKMSENEYSDMLQNNITNIIQPFLTSDDLIAITIDVYNDEYYSEIEELDKNNIKYNSVVGLKSIYFSLKGEENEDESK